MEEELRIRISSKLKKELEEKAKEFINIRNMKCKTLGVQVNCGSFRNKCNRIIEKTICNKV